jgi:hypothetical protein
MANCRRSRSASTIRGLAAVTVILSCGSLLATAAPASASCSVYSTALWTTGGGEFLNGEEDTSCTTTQATNTIAVQVYLQVL